MTVEALERSRSGAPETARPQVDLARPAHALLLVSFAACVAALVHVAAALDLAVPWIVPDEWIYSELAKSIADGGLPSVRGEATLSYGLLYPALIAPAWAIFDDPGDAYVAAKVVNAVVMSLAAFPAFFLARRFVSVRGAAIVGVFSVLIPSMLLSGTLLIENVLYPVFLLALLGIVAALQGPTRRNQLLAVAGVGLACLAKPLSVVLVPAYAMAVLHLALLDRRQGRSAHPRLRAHAPTFGLFAAFASVALASSAVLGKPTAALGVYGVVIGNVDFSGTLVWFVRHLAGLDLYVAVVPFVATLILVALSFGRNVDARINEFAAVALWTILGTLGAVAAYASKPLAGASGYIPSEARLHERNMFVLVPLLLLGMALFLEQRKPGARRLQFAALAVGGSLPVLLPLGRLLGNANYQALAIIPWTAGGLVRFWPWTFIPLAVAACAALLSPAAKAARRSWVLVGVVFVVTTIAAYASMSRPDSGASSTAGLGYETRWIDRATPGGAAVLALWAPPARGTSLDAAYRTIWMSEFFNRSVERVVEVGAQMPYDLPHENATIRNHVLRASDGAPVESEYVLAPCWVSVAGQVVAGDRRARAIVYRLPAGPIRVDRANERPGCGL